MGIQIVKLGTEEEEREKARRKSVMKRLKGYSSEELESMLKEADERETNKMEVTTPTGNFRSGGLVGNQSKLDVDGSGDITGKDLAALRAGHRGRAAKSSMEKS